jgi:quercetin dioxygenase-like cupin family protein
MPYEEATTAQKGTNQADYYTEGLKESAAFQKDYKKRKGVIKAEEMPWEDSPQGRIKHVIHEKMNTTECALEMYQQFLSPGGASGKHRHLSEEVFFVLEGAGYDLHWDPLFDCDETYTWDWEKEPKRFDWEEGDFVYIPPFTTHQHVNSNPEKPARFITATNRIIKAMGLDWQEQVEPAPDYTGKDKS